ncbi:MAG: phosphoribosylformylglycinamidine synthase subunit PurS [Candidatus Bathyarchaeota archaeon]|nr:phosphoribosylformylglycinamidine synthase subunit PurS [Candidatus Bathyarchaeota archaeon]
MEVALKPGHSNPEGETTTRSLKELGYRVKRVEVSKIYTLLMEADSREDVEARLEEICRRLLANPNKDNYSFQVEEAR